MGSSWEAAQLGCYDDAEGHCMQRTHENDSAGVKFRAAVSEEKPLQVAGAINAYTARLAQATGQAPTLASAKP